MNDYQAQANQGIQFLPGLDQYGRGLLNQGWPYPQVLNIKDERPSRQILEDKLKTNNESIKYWAEQIAKAEKENIEIEEVIQELDKHPFLEKFSNLLRRIRG